MAEIAELITFLGSNKVQVQQSAAEIVQGLTGSPEGLSQLTPASATLIPALLQLSQSNSSDVARLALVSLVNLSQEGSTAKQLLALDAVQSCTARLREPSSESDLLVMLLANLTASEEGCVELLQPASSSLEPSPMSFLLERHEAEPSGDVDALEHVASILTNVTRLQEGRAVLLHPDARHLRALSTNLRSPSLVRRKGAAATLRNIIFKAEADCMLERIQSSPETISAMLEPVSGSEEGKEDNGDVREALAEAIMMLAETDIGRKLLWDLHAPEKLRKGYELEEHPGVCAAMEATAELFLQQNGAVEEIE